MTPSASDPSRRVIPIPDLYLVRQIAPQPTVADVAGEVRRQWLNSPVAKRIRRGDRIAVGCGSRGIKHIGRIMQVTVQTLQELGARPFVVAAMGSHGGATPEGQRELLASYHIDEEHLGVPVVTDMDADVIGTNSWGEPVWWDRNALAADGVVTVSRIKPHTDFRGLYESGIVKMVVIGLGKRTGPRSITAGAGGTEGHDGRVGEGDPGKTKFLAGWRSWRTPRRRRPNFGSWTGMPSWTKNLSSSTGPAS